MKTIDSSFTEPDNSVQPPVLSSSAMGMLVFIVTELMFFAALISAYSIINAAAEVWPPADQPRLPVRASALNSLVLFVFLSDCRNARDSRDWRSDRNLATVC